MAYLKTPNCTIDAYLSLIFLPPHFLLPRVIYTYFLKRYMVDLTTHISLPPKIPVYSPSLLFLLHKNTLLPEDAAPSETLLLCAVVLALTLPPTLALALVLVL